MFNKIHKHLIKMEPRPSDAEKTGSDEYPTPEFMENKGFHTKPNSQKGAARARSIGNRDAKSG